MSLALSRAFNESFVDSIQKLLENNEYQGTTGELKKGVQRESYQKLWVLIKVSTLTLHIRTMKMESFSLLLFFRFIIFLAYEPISKIYGQIQYIIYKMHSVNIDH